MFAAALLVMLQSMGAVAQPPPPTLGYVAAKNANPKRLEVFKKGPRDRGAGAPVGGDHEPHLG
jgi:hypothetical protein